MELVSLLIISVLGVHRKRDVDMIDITGAFLTADMDEDFIMVL